MDPHREFKSESANDSAVVESSGGGVISDSNSIYLKFGPAAGEKRPKTRVKKTSPSQKVAYAH